MGTAPSPQNPPSGPRAPGARVYAASMPGGSKSCETQTIRAERDLVFSNEYTEGKTARPVRRFVVRALARREARFTSMRVAQNAVRHRV